MMNIFKEKYRGITNLVSIELWNSVLGRILKLNVLLRKAEEKQRFSRYFFGRQIDL